MSSLMMLCSKLNCKLPGCGFHRAVADSEIKRCRRVARGTQEGVTGWEVGVEGIILLSLTFILFIFGDIHNLLLLEEIIGDLYSK